MTQSRTTREIQGKIFELTLALYRVTDFFPQGEVLRKNVREKANEIFGSITEYGYSPAPEREAASIIAKIGSIKGFLTIVRSMRLVNPVNILVLEREYSALGNFFTKELEGEKQPETKDAVTPVHASERSGRDSGSRPITAEALPTWNEFSLAGESDKGHFNDKGQTLHSKRTESQPSTPKINRTAQGGLRPISEILNERQKKIVEHLKDRDQAKISDFYSFFNDISSKTIQRDLQDLVSRNMLKKEGEKRWTVYSLNNMK